MGRDPHLSVGFYEDYAVWVTIHLTFPKAKLELLFIAALKLTVCVVANY